VFCRLQIFGLASWHSGDGLRQKNFRGGGGKIFFWCFYGPYRLIACSLAVGQCGLLEPDGCVARACGLQLACRRLADRQQHERGMGMARVGRL